MSDLQTVLARRSTAQWVGLILGSSFMVVGLVGFAVTGFDRFAGSVFDEKLFGLPLNPLHNTFHFLGGLAAVVGARRGHRAIKRTAVVIALIFFASVIAGTTGQLKYLAIEDAASPDNWLHLGTGLVALYFGTIGSGEDPRAVARSLDQ